MYPVHRYEKGGDEQAYEAGGRERDPSLSNPICRTYSDLEK